MTHARRSFLNAMLALFLSGFSGLGWPRATAPKAASASKLAAAMEQELGGQNPSASDLIKLEAPDIAEDGAIVPVTIESELANVETIWVFVEKNPTPLAARFDLDKSLDPFVSLRIKMNESCDIIAMVKSEEGYFSAKKKVRVVVGGCG
ncbi:MAG: thiosulfate oxidation carrier protein SoxY [Proteobacteria bacterium]|nr:thiosulfate oxidation carrier protein SoxY [Pseudomonadota bacterium]